MSSDSFGVTTVRCSRHGMLVLLAAAAIQNDSHWPNSQAKFVEDIAVQLRGVCCAYPSDSCRACYKSPRNDDACCNMRTAVL